MLKFEDLSFILGIQKLYITVSFVQEMTYTRQMFFFKRQFYFKKTFIYEFIWESVRKQDGPVATNGII